MDYTGYKRGYLHDDYRLFHIKDRHELELEYHYHEFDKIVVFISGSVTYMIEGTAYFLKPWDILLVGRDQVHRTKIDGATPYERIVLWLSPGFIEKYGGAEPLSACMQQARATGYALVRPEGAQRTELMRLLGNTEEALSSTEYSHELMALTSLLQFLILLNRVSTAASCDPSAFSRDPKLTEILGYINAELAADLSIDALSARFFISPSHLSHSFKAATGYTLHGYITQKRLLAASELIKSGVPTVEAAARCGYDDYSTFLRAFKKLFGCKPRELGSHNIPF